MMKIDQLIGMSRKYGGDENYVLAGGGNTSCKEGDIMAVKASGTSLADIGEAGFVFMDLKALREMPGADYPAEDDAREAAAIRDMMEARLPGQGEKRPSVECILHALFPQRYVLHLHPALVNGMTCGVTGARYAEEHFGDAIWIPLTKPGFILSKACDEAFAAYEKRTGRPTDVVFLQNHGVFVAGDNTEEIDEKMERIMKQLVAATAGLDPTLATAAPNHEILVQATGLLMTQRREGHILHTHYVEAAALLPFAESRAAMAPLLKPFTPDHIVYCKATPLYIENAEDTKAAFETFVAEQGYAPRVAVVKGAGLVGLGETDKEAVTAVAVFLDAVRIAVYSRAFGGPLGLDDDFTHFILNWEIESYRAKKSLS